MPILEQPPSPWRVVFYKDSRARKHLCRNWLSRNVVWLKY
jgi:hypothetical protein